MRFLHNIRIRTKLIWMLSIALCVILCAAATGTLGMRQLNQMQDETYHDIVVPAGYLMDYINALATLRASVRDYAVTTDPSMFAEYDRKLDASTQTMDKVITQYGEHMAQYDIATKYPEEYAQYKILKDNMSSLMRVVDEVREASRDLSNKPAAIAMVQDKFVPLAGLILPTVEALMEYNITEAADNNTKAGQMYRQTLIINSISLWGGALILTLLTLFIIRSISKTSKNILAAAQTIARGELNAGAIEESNNEFGLMAKALNSLVHTFRRLSTDLADLANRHKTGDTDSRMDETAYAGVYKELAIALNSMVAHYVSGNIEILECLNGFSQGDFNAKLRDFPGKQARANRTIELLRANLNAVTQEIRMLVNAALEGQLMTRADASRYHGDWAEIITGLNGVLEAIIKPIGEALYVTECLSQGDFTHRVSGDYAGDYKKIKIALNMTVDGIAGYISEITNVLTALSHNNLNQRVTGDYVGSFVAIKDAVNLILDTLNQVMAEIQTSSEQVSAGARQISESGMALAQGASQQASAVEELTVTVRQVNETTDKNYEYAQKAESLAGTAKVNAAASNTEMKNMLESMEEIRESSVNISRIIKVIDDIALQTNLLALNAAVEAARAGEQGKGFGVVAEEVRNLAARSKEAARQTTELIEDSIHRVKQGADIAQATADAFSKIVENAEQVSRIVSDIAQTSDQQKIAMTQISSGVTQIAEVVNQNSATSEESAAAAEELSSQSNMLHEMTAAFKLRN